MKSHISFSIMVWRFIHIVACVNTSFLLCVCVRVCVCNKVLLKYKGDRESF